MPDYKQQLAAMVARRWPHRVTYDMSAYYLHMKLHQAQGLDNAQLRSQISELESKEQALQSAVRILTEALEDAEVARDAYHQRLASIKEALNVL